MVRLFEIALNGFVAESSEILIFGTWGSCGNQKIHITPDENWEGLVITAYFRLDNEPVGSGLFGEDMTIDIPPKATAKPTSGSVKGKVTFKGTQDGRVIITTDLPYFVLNHSDTEESDNKYTPDQWSQFVSQVDASRKAAEAASAQASKSAAQAAQSLSDTKQVESNVIYQGSTAVQNIQSSLSAATASINAQTNQSLSEIQSKQDEAVAAISEQVGEAQKSASLAAQYASNAEASANAAAEKANKVQQEVESGISAIGNATESAKSEIQTAKTAAVDAVNQTKTQAVSSVITQQNSSIQAVQAAQNTAVQAVQTAQTEGVKAVNDAATEKVEEIEAVNALLPKPTTADAGKVPTVNDAGTGYELRSTLEKNISDYYAMRRTGKVYQTRLWKFVANPTSAGEKLLDNAGLVFEPSTDTEEGPDDYLNGQNPLFEWVNVNYIRDDDGAPRPIAIEGQPEFKTTGAADVGAMQMSFWYKIDASGEDYIDYYVSDTPHPELGLVPWPECVKADGTVLPWCIGSKYISGEASDGLPRSQPGLKPIRNNSYNSMIDTYQQKGPGYWGAGAVRNTFQILFNAIKGATKSSQALYAGCTNYNYQYEAAVQSEDAHTYFPVTNAQAANLVVGSCVSVGYGGNNNGAVNRDRGQASVHAYADDVKILSIETLDDNNMAVYLDIPEESAFNTMPHVHTETLSAPIILSTMHWWSGATKAVKGRHDGSPGSNTNGKYPYRVQGREYSVGGYLVASDTVAWLNEDGSRTVYAAPRGTAHSANTETIQSTYRQIGTIPLNSSGSVADYWVGDAGIDEDTGVWYPSAQGSGSAQGCADIYYAGGDAANLFREYPQCGCLWNGSVAGSCFLHLWDGLGFGGWESLAGD